MQSSNLHHEVQNLAASSGLLACGDVSPTWAPPDSWATAAGPKLAVWAAGAAAAVSTGDFSLCIAPEGGGRRVSSGWAGRRLACDVRKGGIAADGPLHARWNTDAKDAEFGGRHRFSVVGLRSYHCPGSSRW